VAYVRQCHLSAQEARFSDIILFIFYTDIDMQKTMSRFMSGTKIEDILNECPPGFKEASAKAQEFIEAVKSRFGGAKKFMLGGFSQGAILSVQVSLDLPTVPDTVMLLSATIVNGDEWEKKIADRAKQLTIVQSHGTSDQLLPFFIAQKLHGMFKSGGASAEWVEFGGAHSIPPAVIPKVADALEKLLQ
jgi:phospholipase/carboxylesterase